MAPTRVASLARTHTVRRIGLDRDSQLRGILDYIPQPQSPHHHSMLLGTSLIGPSYEARRLRVTRNGSSARSLGTRQGDDLRLISIARKSVCQQTWSAASGDNSGTDLTAMPSDSGSRRTRIHVMEQYAERCFEQGDEVEGKCLSALGAPLARACAALICSLFVSRFSSIAAIPRRKREGGIQ